MLQSVLDLKKFFWRVEIKGLGWNSEDPKWVQGKVPVEGLGTKFPRS